MTHAAQATRIIALKLDLGSGAKPVAEGWTGVDLRPPSDGVEFDFSSGRSWPFADESVSELHSSHLIEHLEKKRVVVPTQPPERERRQDLLFWFFEEAYRVAQPGARFTVRWPALRNDDAFADPTHYRQLPIGFLLYLSTEGQRARNVESYDVRCNWVLDQLLGLPRRGSENVNLSDPDNPPPWNAVSEYVALLRRGAPLEKP